MAISNTLQERLIVDFVYGLTDTIPLTPVQVGNVLNISTTKVRYDLNRAIWKLARTTYKTPLKRYKAELDQVRQGNKYRNVDTLINSIVI